MPEVLDQIEYSENALDIKPDLKPGITKKDLLKAMKDHVIAEGQRMGTYQRE